MVARKLQFIFANYLFVFLSITLSWKNKRLFHFKLNLKSIYFVWGSFFRHLEGDQSNFRLFIAAEHKT